MKQSVSADRAEVYHNRGIALIANNNLLDALADFDNAIRFNQIFSKPILIAGVLVLTKAISMKQ